MNNSRREAAFALMRYLAAKEFPQKLISDGPERAFIQEVLYVAVRRLRALRFILGKYVRKWPKGELEALLYIGAAQILFMDSIPDFAAVNETVNAAKICSNPSVAKVVNGTLRNLIRNRAEIESLLRESPLETRESFPTILVKRWIKAFGEEDAARLCRLYNTPAETFLARPDGSYTVLERGVKVSDVSGYAEGEFIVQDPATKHAVELANVCEGIEALDACAAPGGKTVQLAWRGAKVTACEVNPRRRKVLFENIARTKIAVDVVGSFDEIPAGKKFDVVLVDAPCSNTGVFRRRPDARWNWSLEKMTQLAALQAQILEAASKFVKPGGRLIYSTCSIEDEENIFQVREFISSHPDVAVGEMRSVLPFKTGTDGSFACELVKKYSLLLSE